MDKRNDWLRYAAVLLAWSLPLSFFIFQTDFLYGFDAYYHVQVSEFMAIKGLRLESFPWVTESIWADSWFDKDWLFHVLLIPFLGFGKALGPQLAILFLNAMIVLSVIYFMRGLRLTSRSLCMWAALLPFFCWGIFWVRLILCRPHLLSLAVLFLALGAMVRRRAFLLGFSGMLYALCYTGHWQLLGLVFIYDFFFHVFESDGTRRKRVARCIPMLLPSFTGVVLGNLIHPDFPANVKGLYVQNVLVLLEAWTGQTPSIPLRPVELKGLGSNLFSFCAPVFVLGGALGVRRWLDRVRLTRVHWIVLIYALGYMVLAFKSHRFLEYAVPMSVVCIALFAADLKLHISRFRLAFGALLVSALLIFGMRGYLHYFHRYAVVQRKAQDNQHRYSGSAQHLARLKPGTVVFSTSWADNAVLWYQAPQLRFPAFLDPMFMQFRDPDKFALYLEIIQGRHPKPLASIYKDFGSQVIYLRVGKDDAFAKQLEILGAFCLHQGRQGDCIFVLRPQK